MSKERFLLSRATGVSACDERGAGNANHLYRVYNGDTGSLLQEIKFQNGPIQEMGVNGIQNEDLLEIVIDRLIGFQAGAFACDENEAALRLIIDAISILQLRTARRIAREVEGRSIL